MLVSSGYYEGMILIAISLKLLSISITITSSVAMIEMINQHHYYGYHGSSAYNGYQTESIYQSLHHVPRIIQPFKDTTGSLTIENQVANVVEDASHQDQLNQYMSVYK